MGAGLSGSPMTPVEAWKTSDGLHFSSFAARRATAFTVATPGLAGEGVGIAGIDRRWRGPCPA